MLQVSFSTMQTEDYLIMVYKFTANAFNELNNHSFFQGIEFENFSCIFVFVIDGNIVF